MSRKPKYKKRNITPDRLYKNKLVSKFINHVMLDGKKTIAERSKYQSVFFRWNSCKRDQKR